MNRESILPAVFAYLTPIGWVIGLLLNNEKQSLSAKFHLRQALGLYLIYFAILLAAGITARLPFIGYLALGIIGVLNICFVVFSVLGVIWAATGREKLLPLIGHWAQDKLRIIIP